MDILGCFGVDRARQAVVRDFERVCEDDLPARRAHLESELGAIQASILDLPLHIALGTGRARDGIAALLQREKVVVALYAARTAVQSLHRANPLAGELGGRESCGRQYENCENSFHLKYS